MHYLYMRTYGVIFMDRAELGNKRLCNSCGTKFDDLKRSAYMSQMWCRIYY